MGGSHDNDLRRLGLSSAQVIANLRDEVWPATPGHENDGTVALINTFRHMFSRLSPSMWQVAERLEGKISLLKYAWQKLPLGEKYRRQAADRILSELTHTSGNSVSKMYSRIFPDFWTLPGVARWYEPFEYWRKLGTTNSWTMSNLPADANNHTWFRLKNNMLPEEAFKFFQGRWTIESDNVEKFLVFLRPEFLRIRWNCSGSQDPPQFEHLQVIIINCVRPDTITDPNPIFDEVRYILDVAIKSCNNKGHSDSLRLYNKKSHLPKIKPFGNATSITEFGNEGGYYELIYAKVKESDHTASGTSTILPALWDNHVAVEHDSPDAQNRKQGKRLGPFDSSSEQNRIGRFSAPRDSAPPPRKKMRTSGPVSGALSSPKPARVLTLGELEGALSGSYNEIDMLKGQLETMRMQRDDANDRFFKKSQDIDLAQDQTRASRWEHDNTLKELDQAKQELVKKSGEVENAQEQTRVLRTQYENTLKELADTKQELLKKGEVVDNAKVSREKLITQAKEKSRKSVNEINELRKELDDTKQQLTKKVEDVDSAQNQSRVLRGQYDTTVKELDDTKQQLVQKSEDVDKTQARYELLRKSAHERLSERSKELKDVRKELYDTKQQLSKKSEDVDEAQGRIQALRAQVDGAVKDRDGFKSQLTKKCKELDKGCKEVSAAGVKIDSLGKERDVARKERDEQAAKLGKQLDGIVKERDQYRERATKFCKQVQDTIKERDQYRGQVDTISTDLQTTSAQLQTARVEAENAQTQNNFLLKEHDVLKRSNVWLQTQLQGCQERIQQLSSEQGNTVPAEWTYDGLPVKRDPGP